MILLDLIGINMIREMLKGESKEANASLSPAVMVPVAVAKIIDAFAVGITLTVLGVNILPWHIDGTTTLLIVFVGVWIGHFFGNKSERKVGILGSAILILIGIRVFAVGQGISNGTGNGAFSPDSAYTWG